MSKKICTLAILATLSMIFSYVESLFPLTASIPGIKVGFANIVILTILYQYGFKEALGINIIRVILSGILFGNLFNIIYSLAGAISSIVIMKLLININKFSIYGISIIGGITHNVAQIIVAIVILKTSKIIYYLPFLFLAAIISGMLVGLLSAIVLKHWKGLNIND